MKLSVIIPALNEASNIASAIENVVGRAEVIVADGGSIDGTPGAARALGARVVETPPGRGLQMDAGARAATGDVLVFLHADTVLPAGWNKAIEEALSRDGVAAGAFRLRIGSPGAWFRLIELAAALRARLFGLVYGDQAMFVRRDVFLRAGGFNKLPLMEDVDCVKRLRRFGSVVLLKEAVVTSPRRWARKGALVASLKNSALLALYFMGVSPERLYGWYYGERLGRGRGA